MWFLRELSRLLFRIAVAVAIACVIAGARALVSGGGFLHAWKITDLLLGCFLLLLAAGSRSSGAARRLNWTVITPRLPQPIARAEGPQLTAAAVFAGSGLVVIALGVLA